MRRTILLVLVLLAVNINTNPLKNDDIDARRQNETPADVPTDTTVDAGAGTPADVPTDTTVDAGAGTPADVPTDIPADAGTGTPADATAEAPADAPADASPDPADDQTTVADGTTEPYEKDSDNQKEDDSPSTISGNFDEDTPSTDDPSTIDKDDEDVSRVELTLGTDDTTPENVVTDQLGNPLVTSNSVNFTFLHGEKVMLVTEDFRTYYTRPATIPGCMCVSRGPLPPLKLYGNIHFPWIKRVPPGYVTAPTNSTTTVCPPCDCSTCNTAPIDLGYGLYKH